MEKQLYTTPETVELKIEMDASSFILGSPTGEKYNDPGNYGGFPTPMFNL